MIVWSPTIFAESKATQDANNYFAGECFTDWTPTNFSIELFQISGELVHHRMFFIWL